MFVGRIKEFFKSPLAPQKLDILAPQKWETHKSKP
jgi:hypothetical protein